MSQSPANPLHLYLEHCEISKPVNREVREVIKSLVLNNTSSDESESRDIILWLSIPEALKPISEDHRINSKLGDLRSKQWDYLQRRLSEYYIALTKVVSTISPEKKYDTRIDILVLELGKYQSSDFDQYNSDGPLYTVDSVDVDQLLKNKKYKELLESYEDRSKNVVAFLKKIKPHLQLQIVPINDIYGPTASDATLEALIVSGETYEVSKELNVMRRKKGLKDLELMVIDVINHGDEDNSGNSTKSNDSSETDLSSIKISSTDIRKELAKKSLSP
ncbi:hypothetical protein H4219_003315 [Mycoemilia scoparia]|uniref:Uncharacterized protein n=1 Tax=Mycoemilia scoparia TaxID=417184 RepID=A0A9W8DTJ1_9FUNG|nr:hypothetical protein H4219_003315 [Mycoemilia scoparia]